jgi:hypothetical protein
MNLDFISSAKRLFHNYKLLGEKTFEQVNDEALFFKYNEDSNSIALIVKHLHGNMLSRWTDFLTSDGEKEWRQRDDEFENAMQSRSELLKTWNEGWDCLFKTLDTLNEADLTKTIYIRNEAHSVMDAVNRQLAHYPYHIGQIVYLGKMLSDKEWKSLSIPKNKSKEFNSDKFSKPKN